MVSNGLFYSLIGIGRTKKLLLRGASLGLLAGLGAIILPEPFGLDDKPVAKMATTKVLTIGWYVVGGIVAGMVRRDLRSRSDK